MSSTGEEEEMFKNSSPSYTDVARQGGTRGSAKQHFQSDQSSSPNLLGDQSFLTSKEEQDFIEAKSFLLTASSKTGLNLYDHLCDVITKVLEERKPDAVETLEDISKETKRFKFQQDNDTMVQMTEPSPEMASATLEMKLFLKGEEEFEEHEEDVESPLPNLMESVAFFEQAGIGFSKEEFIKVWMALKQLVDTQPLQHVRFWGKIFGIEQNYYVAEVEYRDGEQAEDEEDEEEQADLDTDNEPHDDVNDDGPPEEEEPPKPDYKPPPSVPKEEKGTGANKKSYFVCTGAGKPWVCLPSVTPIQILAARQIKKYFTGRLDAPVVTYPPFPGSESNYLRAQIARISAGTHISPLGFYTFDDDEEVSVQGGARDTYVENIDFEGVPLREMSESIGTWVHHVMHILVQGRCKWWYPMQKNDDDLEEEIEEVERDDPDEIQSEEGPPLLTPLSEDANIGDMPAWTSTISSNLVPQYAVAVVHSNLWPGAHAYATNKKFDNIYIGWGHKYSAENYNPAAVPAPLDEYKEGSAVTEVDDPTPEQEAAAKASLQIKDGDDVEEAEEEEEEEEG